MKITKKTLIASIVMILLITTVGYFISSSNKTTVKNVSQSNSGDVEMAIPTTDASTIATLSTINAGKEVSLKLEGIPNGTETVDYELSYSTKQQGFQGVIGMISLSEKEKNFEKKITLGTCSSGRCVYHEVVGAIKVTLKFNGSYGEKIMEKEFVL